ncbi:putative E3 ubiquitin-protein ligase makorin-2 [Trichinella pseudospiralis]|uniref:Putative E3 ubiquitin-protein ligase makorin-2 n=1 Tax=Trichinella pseudospiralis TaxID=6337 RepID=A0A0V1EL57_TRIPS|nr:putative E3 ubiquitin-protein ligase makorin-2 [Trichinella pseudospiralis]KRZ23744.1 putative E3 ubiquitin-protein ligase makorin-2 [Trichinella pseudospiralis]KRZ39812.1 putative E3 ubiquitin-protein ligase makorin-2 [Trichinella pseudospiralis]
MHLQRFCHLVLFVFWNIKDILGLYVIVNGFEGFSILPYFALTIDYGINNLLLFVSLKLKGALPALNPLCFVSYVRRNDCTNGECLYGERFSPRTRHHFRYVCEHHLNKSFLNYNEVTYHDLQTTYDLSSEEEIESFSEDEAGRKISNDSESPFLNESYASDNEEGAEVNEFNLPPSKVVCSICTEAVLKKKNEYSRVFAFMPNCRHYFCFECIDKWRKRIELSEEIRLGCPMCRTVSQYVVPSSFWQISRKKRADLVACFEFGMKKRLCMSTQHGNHRCPYGNSCPCHQALYRIFDDDFLRAPLEPRWQALLGNLAALFNPNNFN